MFHFIALLLTVLHLVIAVIVGGIGSVFALVKAKNFRELTSIVLVVGGIYMLVGTIFFPVFAITTFAVFWPAYILTLYFLHLKKNNTLP